MREASHRRSRLVPVRVPVLVLSPLLLLLLSHGEVPAQVLQKNQQTCAAVMHAGLERVAETRAAAVLACIKAGAQGKLDGGVADTVDGCITADAKQKVAKAAAKTTEDFAKKCAGESLPPYGVTGPAAVNTAASDGQDELVYDLVGTKMINPTVILESLDKPGAKCQQALLREAQKCHDVKLAEFGRCARAGLKDKAAPFDGADDLETCIGLDPDGTIARQCDLRQEAAPGRLKLDAIRKTLARACVDEGVALATAIPGCAADDVEAAHACIDRAVECRVCLALDRAAGLDRDCDLFDDGTANQSCVPGPLVIGAHQCVLDPTASPFRLDTAAVGLRLELSGVLDLECGEVDPATGRAPCTCAIASLDPLGVVPLGFACIGPAEGCVEGSIDCDGGDALGASITALHDIGACVGNDDCAAQCAARCAESGAVVLESGCEGFCRGGASDGLACAADSLCPGGLCIGPDLVLHGNTCQCQCAAPGSVPSRPGGLRCNLGIAVTIEKNPPCGDGDVLADLGRQCVPLTTESLAAVIVNANDLPMTELPPGGRSLTGRPVSCPTLMADVTAGLGLVTAVGVLDAPGVGDIALGFSFDCL